MSKIFHYENQMILRLPLNLADSLNQKIENSESLELDLTPFVEKSGDGCENHKFKFKKFQSITLL